MNIITGYTGEPHITSAQDRDGNQGAYGVNSYILDIGSRMAASIISANEIRIADGALSHQGCLGNIDSGLYESCAISNGEQGMKRSDLIVCRYEKNSETNVESLSLVVIEGTPDASTPADPSYNEGSIQAGDTPVDMPLFRVNINGVNVTSVTQIASNVKTQAELTNDLSAALIARTYTYAYSVSANSAINLSANNFGVTTPTGYLPVAIRTAQSGVLNCVIRSFNVSATGTNTIMSLYNNGSSTASGTATLSILFAKGAIM